MKTTALYAALLHLVSVSEKQRGTLDVVSTSQSWRSTDGIHRWFDSDLAYTAFDGLSTLVCSITFNTWKRIQTTTELNKVNLPTALYSRRSRTGPPLSSERTTTRHFVVGDTLLRMKSRLRTPNGPRTGYVVGSTATVILRATFDELLSSVHSISAMKKITFYTEFTLKYPNKLTQPLKSARIWLLLLTLDGAKQPHLVLVSGS